MISEITMMSSEASSSKQQQISNGNYSGHHIDLKKAGLARIRVVDESHLYLRGELR